MDKKVIFSWNSLIHAFQDKEFNLLLEDYISIELGKDIYRNIIKSGLHLEAIKTLVLPCPDVIEWITQKIDHENREILNLEDKSVSNWKALVVN